MNMNIIYTKTPSHKNIFMSTFISIDPSFYDNLMDMIPPGCHCQTSLWSNLKMSHFKYICCWLHHTHTLRLLQTWLLKGCWTGVGCPLLNISSLRLELQLWPTINFNNIFTKQILRLITGRNKLDLYLLEVVFTHWEDLKALDSFSGKSDVWRTNKMLEWNVLLVSFIGRGCTNSKNVIRILWSEQKHTIDIFEDLLN